MTKKRFKTKLSKKQKRKNIFFFFLFQMCSYLFALLFCFFIDIVDDWKSLETYIIALAMSLFIPLMLMFPSSIAAITLGIQVGKSKRIRDDATYIPVQNIDYYRENLNEISPSLASLLIDLDIYENDIVATLLRMYNKKAICFQKNGRIKVSDKNIKELDNGERELLYLIKKGKLSNKKALSDWKKERFREAEHLGYIKKKESNGDKNPSRYLMATVISIPIAFILWGLLLHSKILDIVTVVDYIIAHACLIVINMFIFVPFYLCIKEVCYKNRGDVLWERTALGNEMSEKIAGLSRYIHEFSLLSEAKKEEVVLWDDYLVYAIVLEENEKIVEEISKINKINLRSIHKMS